MNGSHLFNRELSADYQREWTERIAAPAQAAETATASVVIFRVWTEWLALPTAAFEQVVESCKLHIIPHRLTGVVAGLVTIRGELLLCASLRHLLALGDAGRREQKGCERLLVANRNGNRIAFPVDEIHGIVRYRPTELLPVPATLAHAVATYTIGLLPWRNTTVGCLNDELLFYTLDRSFA